MIEVIDNLLAAPDIKEPVKLVQPKIVYVYADPDLEGRSIGQRILMRIGSDNEAKVKTKLQEIRQELFLHGAAVLVLEEWDAAHARGAHIYGEILGGASTADAHHITAPSPGGAGAIACIDLALAEAGVAPADIKQINAHGTSTPLNDAAEAQAIEKVFGTPGPPSPRRRASPGTRSGRRARSKQPRCCSRWSARSSRRPQGSRGDPDMHIDIVHGEPRRGSPGRRCRTRSASAATTASW